MADPTPIPVPRELAGLANQYPEAVDALRQARERLETIGDLDEKTIELTRIAALIGLAAPAASFRAHVRRARSAGATDAEIWAVVMSIATLVGVPRLLETVPSIEAALIAE